MSLNFIEFVPLHRHFNEIAIAQVGAIGNDYLGARCVAPVKTVFFP